MTKRRLRLSPFRKYLLLLFVLAVLGGSNIIRDTPNDGSPLSIASICIYIALFIGALILLYSFGIENGLRAPRYFRSRKKSDKTGHIKEIISAWASWNSPFYEDMMDAGVAKQNAYRWIEKLARMNFTAMEARRARKTIVKIASLGMTADNFEHLYKLGINKKEDFIRIAESDIDASIALGIFDTVDGDQRRIMRIDGKQEVFEIA